MADYACSIVNTVLLLAYIAMFIGYGRDEVFKKHWKFSLGIIVLTTAATWILPIFPVNYNQVFLLGISGFCMLINWSIVLSVFVFSPQIFIAIFTRFFGAKLFLEKMNLQTIRCTFIVIIVTIALGMSSLSLFLMFASNLDNM